MNDPDSLPDSAAFARFRERLARKNADVAEPPVLYTAFGDSVTQGWFEHATCDHPCSFPTQFKLRVERRYPAAAVNLINAGVAGDTAARSLNRIERDLLRYPSDLVTIAFGANDAHGGSAGLDAYRRSLTEIIRLVRENSDADLLLITPSWMMLSDNPFIHVLERKYVDTFVQLAERRTLSDYREAMLEAASLTHTSCLDIYAMWQKMHDSGIDIHARLANGINHPDRAIHERIAEAMERLVVG
ncbi:SGNH/GDSL hydrolase family protein [Paenibacillus sp. HJGM_3]|uniref:SGNH/GDSL hydrolase family protein n=1 Tax=Paenibacillus sp. HJGM_3 TaxID=3379816 RepID=UPI00385B5FA7